MTNTNLQVIPTVNDRAGGMQGSGATGEPGSPRYLLMAEHPAWPMIRRLPVSLGVQVSLRGLKVRDLLDLRCGQTVASTWAVTEDVPLQAGTQAICWGEFEVAEQRIAIRLTRLA